MFSQDPLYLNQSNNSFRIRIITSESCHFPKNRGIETKEYLQYMDYKSQSTMRLLLMGACSEQMVRDVDPPLMGFGVFDKPTSES